MLCLARLHLLPTTSAQRSPAFTHPPGGSLIPLAPHPLPHRSALMSGKNKTASPTAKAEFHPPLRRRTTPCIGKKGSRESETGEGNGTRSRAEEVRSTRREKPAKEESEREREKGKEKRLEGERRRRADRAEFQEVRRWWSWRWRDGNAPVVSRVREARTHPPDSHPPFRPTGPLPPSPPSRLRGMLIPGALILTNISPVPGDDRGRFRKDGRWRRRTNQRTYKPRPSEGEREREKGERRGLSAKKKTKEQNPPKARRSLPPWYVFPSYCPSFSLCSHLSFLFATLCSSYTRSRGF